MKPYLLCFLLVLLHACNPAENTPEFSLLNYISKDTSFLVRTSNFNAFKSNLTSNQQFSNWVQMASFKNAAVLVAALQNLESDTKALIAVKEIGKNNMDFLFVGNTATTSLNNYTAKKNKQYEGIGIQVHQPITQGQNPELYSATMARETLYSTSILMIENAIRAWKGREYPKALQGLFKASKQEAIYFSLEGSGWLAKNHFLPFTNKGFGKWGVLHINLENKKIEGHGFNSRNDTLPYFLNLFAKTSPGTLKAPQYAPSNLEMLWSYGIPNYEAFERQQRIYLNKALPMDTLFKHIKEVAHFKVNQNHIALVYLSNTENMMLFFSRQAGLKTTYQGVTIFAVQEGELITNSFAPLLNHIEPKYGFIKGQAAFFSNSIAALQTIIGNLNTKTTLANTHAYKATKELLAQEANLLFYKAQNGTFKPHEPYEYLLSGGSNKEDTQVFVSQWVADQDFFHQHLAILEIPDKKKSQTVSPIFTVHLKAPLTNTIQWVKNHLNKEQDIVVQDQNHQLYLINNKGKILWKKQLTSPIQGRINQVDLYKNGKLQMAFTTKDQLLILDRNGKEVSPFNKTYKGEALGPLAVFDYDNNKEYRFVFSQDKTIYMYDRNGKRVTGFKYKKASAALAEVPKHYKIKGADYLVFKQINGQLSLLNRRGNTRVKTQKKYVFSDNEIMLYKGKFSFTDLSGNLIQIATNGKQQSKPLRVNATHKTVSQYNQLVVLEDNVLYSNGKKATLDFGIYTAPNIFRHNKERYITLTDLQNNKAYLFNDQLKMLPQFPVFGSGALQATDMDQDGNLELLTKDKEHSLIVYRINK